MATSPSYHGNYSDKDQPTLNTVVDYVNDARILLQDVIVPYRYDDPSLVIALNVALLDARRLRGDLFLFKREVKGQAQSFTEVDNTYVDMEPQFRLPLLYGLCGHALARDQEDYQDARSQSFMRMFGIGFVGRATTGVAGGAGPGRPA